MIFFLIGLILSGIAPTMDLLIGFRALQGLGAGGLMPLAMIIMGDLFPPRERAKWQGAASSIIGLSALLGPIIGGWITDHLSWRWVFYINVPFMVVVLVLLLFQMPRLQRAHGRLHLDSLGVVLLVCGAVPLLIGLSWAGSQYPWGAWQVWGLIGGGVIAMIAFFVHEARCERHGGEPIIGPSLFKSRIFTISLLAFSITFMGLFGGVMFLPLYLQGILQISATVSSLFLTPMFFAIMVGTIIAGQLITRTGRYKLLALVGMGLTVTGVVLLLQLGLSSGAWAVIVAIAVMGLGVGISLTLYGTIVQSAWPQRIAQGTSTLEFFQELGGPLALAVMGSIQAALYGPAFLGSLPKSIKAVVPTQLLPVGQPDILLNSAARDALGIQIAKIGHNGRHVLEQIVEAVRAGLMQSLHGVFLISLGILLVGLGIVCFLPEVELKEA